MAKCSEADPTAKVFQLFSMWLELTENLIDLECLQIDQRAMQRLGAWLLLLVVVAAVELPATLDSDSGVSRTATSIPSRFVLHVHLPLRAAIVFAVHTAVQRRPSSPPFARFCHTTYRFSQLLLLIFPFLYRNP